MNPSSWFGAGGDSSLKVLWEDGERVFCRRESRADGDRAAVLAVLPAAEHPTPATLDRLAREYGLKDELDGAWAVRPLELVRERGRMKLVLEDTRSEPLDRRGQAHRLRYCFASAARAPGAGAARIDRGHARLYGARTDRTNEPLDRCPQRPLRPRRHALSDAHGLTAVYRGRSHGVGPLPYRQKAGAAKRAAGDRPGASRRPHPEAARQERGGPLPDCRRRRVRSAALLGPIGARGHHRRLPVRPAGYARPAADP